MKPNELFHRLLDHIVIGSSAYRKRHIDLNEAQIEGVGGGMAKVPGFYMRRASSRTFCRHSDSTHRPPTADRARSSIVCAPFAR